jgi:hypothetical protein
MHAGGVPFGQARSRKGRDMHVMTPRQMASQRCTLGSCLMFLCALVLAASACASTWIPSIRPLTEDERMELGVGLSDAVGIGSILAVKDSIDDAGMKWSWMVFRPEKWLKGSAALGVIRIYFPGGGVQQRASSLLRESSPACLVFIHRVNDARQPYWALREHPDIPGGGLLRVGDRRRHLEDGVTRATTKLSLEGMVQRSPLVVVGTVGPLRKLQVQGRPIPCSEILVDSVIVGHFEAPLRVYSLYGALEAYGPMLLMLKPGEAGAHELVGFTAGARPILGTTVEGLRDDLPTVSSRVRKIASSPTSGKGH